MKIKSDLLTLFIIFLTMVLSVTIPCFMIAYGVLWNKLQTERKNSGSDSYVYLWDNLDEYGSDGLWYRISGGITWGSISILILWIIIAFKK